MLCCRPRCYLERLQSVLIGAGYGTSLQSSRAIRWCGSELEPVLKEDQFYHTLGMLRTLLTAPRDCTPWEWHGEPPKPILPHSEGFNPLIVGMERWMLRG